MQSAPPLTITEVISSFLGAAPTLQEIIAFRLPESLERRGLTLLERSRDGTLSDEERSELDEFTRMGHFMNRVKLQARLKLASEA